MEKSVHSRMDCVTMSITAVYFDNISYFRDKLPNHAISLLDEKVNNIKENFNTLVATNNSLAGNIAREYNFDKETLSEIENLVLPYAKLYYQKNPMVQVGHISENYALSKLYLNNAWVNFQKKYEFNPSHTHTGVISFVIWLKVPYTIKQEMTNKSVAYSNSPVAGCFQFMYCDALGNINGHTISCEKETEGTILIFPAKMQHCVYPFFTSDEYRISISGNFYIKDH